nr:uncharacterized protein LOC111429257 [Onthophagus taurus]
MLTNSVRSSRSKLSTYVRWKALICFGTIFWILMCLTDDVRERRVEEEILTQTGVDNFFEEKEVLVKEEYLPHLVQLEEEDDSLSITRVIFWNLVAFLSTFCACFTLKSLTSQSYWGEVDTKILTNQLVIRKCSSSRIPIPVSSKTSSTDIHINSNICQVTHVELCNKSCPNLFRLEDVHQEKKNLKRNWSIKVMEKHCAKLRDEMINLQTTSLKEHASITKRLDLLSREKRELSRQLSFTSKENTTLKQQLDELVEERNMLIRRLESATKELKANTKSKKATMAKLDESMSSAENFKTNLEQITRDKEILEDKLMILDAEYKRVQEELAFYKDKEKRNDKVKDDGRNELKCLNKEHVIDVYEMSDDNRTVASREAGDMDEENEKNRKIKMMEDKDFDVTRPEKDMIKVQQKLITLERSLENFKVRDGVINRQEKFDLYPVNENEIFLDTRNRLFLPQQPFFKLDSQKHCQPTATSSSSPSLPAPKSSHSSCQSNCSEEQCQLDHKDCLDPECHRHHRRRRRDPTLIPGQNIICTEPKCTLEHRECGNAECFLQRHSYSSGAVGSIPPNNSTNKGNETASSSESSLCQVVGKEPMMMLSQKPIRYLKTTVSDDRLSAISEKLANIGDDSGDEFEPKRKIFTNTPEFQKLLKEILDPQRSSDEAVRETEDSEFVY